VNLVVVAVAAAAAAAAVTQCTHHNGHHFLGGIWRATIDPASYPGLQPFTSLFVNGSRQVRARFPNGNPQVTKNFSIDAFSIRLKCSSECSLPLIAIVSL